MENINFQAIIGAETPMETNLLAELGLRTKVPIISFLPTAFAAYPHFVQFTQDETSQVKGIAFLMETFRLRDIILVYEDTDYGQELIPSMIGSFQDVDIHVVHKIAIKSVSSNEQITEQLYKPISLQTRVFVVHLSPSLESLLFLNVKKFGMMDEGYV